MENEDQHFADMAFILARAATEVAPFVRDKNQVFTDAVEIFETALRVALWKLNRGNESDGTENI